MDNISSRYQITVAAAVAANSLCVLLSLSFSFLLFQHSVYLALYKYIYNFSEPLMHYMLNYTGVLPLRYQIDLRKMRFYHNVYHRQYRSANSSTIVYDV